MECITCSKNKRLIYFRTLNIVPKILAIFSCFVPLYCYYLFGTNHKSELMVNLLHPAVHSSTTNKKIQKWKMMSTEKVKPPSVIVIGVDSVSRLNMYRQLRKSKEILKSNGFVELKGYNRVGHNTFPNMMGLLGGMKFGKWPCYTSGNDSIDSCPFIWKNYSTKGYITGFIEDAPNMAIFNYLKTGFVNPPTDYYLRPLFIAAHELNSKNGPFCFGSMNPTEVLANYIKEFARLNSNYPYFLFSWFTSIGHEELNDVHTGDKVFSRLLEAVVKEPNTIVFFMSDHGIRYGSIHDTFNGYYEESLPFFFVRLPSRLKRIFPEWDENLQNNQNKLTTPLDVFTTLHHILNQTNTPRSMITGAYSLFQKIPNNRTCVNAHIPQEFCRCGQIPDDNKTPDNAIYLANYLVSVVNGYVKPLIKSELCHFLVLSKLIYGRKFLPKNRQEENQEYSEYLIAFQVVPGDGKFRGQVRLFKNKTMEAVGSVYRIDSYVTTANCVNDWAFKNYCMCQSQVKMPF